MGTKKRNIYWYQDWRPWACLLVSFAIVLFWAVAGYYYLGMGSGIDDINEFDQMARQHFSRASVNANSNTWLFGLISSLIAVVWLMGKGANVIINQRSIVSAKDKVLLEIPVCKDRAIINLNAALEIDVTAVAVAIPKEILCTASKKALARDIGWLLYLRWNEIEKLILAEQNSAMDGLADLILDNWTLKEIGDFIIALGNEKEYISQMLNAIVKIRSRTRQVIQLNEEIKSIRQRAVSSATQDSNTPNCLANHLDHYNELASGKSAAIKWLRQTGKKLSSKVIKQ